MKKILTALEMLGQLSRTTGACPWWTVNGWSYDCDDMLNGVDENYPFTKSQMMVCKRERGKLNPFPDKQGYSQVKLSNIEGRKNRKVHRLVATAFIPNPLNLSDWTKERNQEIQ